MQFLLDGGIGLVVFGADCTTQFKLKIIIIIKKKNKKKMNHKNNMVYMSCTSCDFVHVITCTK